MKFTIIIPCFNSEKWIEECLLSALKQTYSNLEVIFVDNESTDKSLEIAKKIQQQYPHLVIDVAKNIYKYSYQEPVEKALEISTGKFFTILGSDDFIDDRYVENIVSILNKSDKIKALQSPIRGIKNNLFVSDLKHEYNSLTEFKNQLFTKCPVNTPSIVLSKDLYNSGIVRWDSEKYLGSSDYDLYFNLANNNIFVYPYPQWIGYYYRWHDNQSTWGMHKENKNYDKLIKDTWRKKWNI